jgi:hypothetical protein
MKLKLRKYMKELCIIKVKTLRMLLMYNLAKRAGKKQGEKSVGLEVKLPANVMRTLDGDLKQRKSTLLQL